MKFSLPTLAAFFVTLLPSLVSAWGRLGHESVALVAQNYLLPGTIEKARALLDDNTSTYLANVALWADSYRNTPEGRFSGGYHFVNGKDAPPPDECHIHYPTDCPPEGCVISAIGNYTERLMNPKNDKAARAEALKFLVHFIGDITQPLHTEALGLGGNSILVTFNTRPTNLHAAWDTSIPHALASVNTTSSPNNQPTLLDSLSWSLTLTNLINAGPFKSLATSRRWLKSHPRNLAYHPRHPELLIKTASKTATAWAQAANELVCEYAIAEQAEGINGTEIGEGTGYFESVRRYKIVEAAVAMAGVRLAGWLNLVFEGEVGFGDKC